MSPVKERPILFKGEMVRAILAGTKTQTRRIAKEFNGMQVDAILQRFPNQKGCPYGELGDRLWVKETWRTARSLDSKSPSTIGEMCVDAGYRKPWAPLSYEADGHRNSEWGGFELHGEAEPGKTRVSIHMPRWASRITLEVTGVRVERLQDISRGDAMSEGCPFPNMATGDDPRNWFRDLWASINGAGSWAADPWVWVVEFRRIEP